MDLVWGYQLEFLTLNSDLYIITGAGTGLGKECANYFSKNSLVIGTFNKSRFKKKKNLIAHKLDLENKKSIDVVTGSLCLFPSSLLHYTIPFESEENRIVLAFDMIPNL